MPNKNPKIPQKTREDEGARKSRKQPKLLMVNENNIEMVENETVHRVNKTLSALEIAISTWDASEKPEAKKDKFMRYKWLHDALTEWETKFLRSASKRMDYPSRLQRLEEFARICHSYAGG